MIRSTNTEGKRSLHCDISQLSNPCFLTRSYKLFMGNNDRSTEVIHQVRELVHPLLARYVRLHPQTWQGHVSMRFEVYGCPHFAEGLRAYFMNLGIILLLRFTCYFSCRVCVRVRQRLRT